MRRKTTNKKVLQAISIGLSAMIATTSIPMTAFAAEGDATTGNPDEPHTVDVDATTTATSTTDQAQSAAGAAIKDISGAIGDTNSAAQAVEDAKLTNTDTITTPGETNPTQKLTDTADIILGTEGTGLNNPASVISGPEGIVEDLGEAALFEGAADAAITNANTKVSNPGDAQNTGLLEKAENASAASKLVADQATGDLALIQNATSISDAQATYNNLGTVITTANTNFDTALGEYDQQLAAYNTQLELIKKLETAYNEEVKAAGNGVDKLITVDKDGKVTAAGELAAAKQKAEELKAAADAAAAKLNQNAQNMLEIDRLISFNNTDTDAKGNPTVAWGSADGQQDMDSMRLLFKKVMLFYYLPEKGIISQDKVEEYSKNPNFNVNDYIKSVTDTKDSTKTYHYFEDEAGVKYYFNYKLNGGTGTDIVIFEKRGVEIDSSNVDYDQFEEYKNEAGKKVDVKKDASIISVDKDGDTKDDAYLQINGTGVTKDNLSKEGDIISTSTDGNTQVRIDEINGAEEVSYSYNPDTKEVVKTVKQGATTVTYVKKSSDVSLETQTAYASEAEARAALEKQLDVNLKTADKDIVYDSVELSGTVNTKESWEAKGTYKPVFSATTSIKKKYDTNAFGLLNKPKPAEAKSDFDRNSLNLLKTEVEKNGIVVDKVTQYGKIDDDFDLVNNWKISTHTYSRDCTYNYTNSSTGEVTGKGTSANLAIADANTKIDNYKDQFKSAVGYKNKSLGTAVMTGVQYSATFTYWEKTSTTGTTVVDTSKTTYSDADTSEITGSMIQNKIYEDYKKGIYDDSLMTLNDKSMKNNENVVVDLNLGMNDKIDEAKALKSKYDGLASKAKTAVEDYNTALSSVKALSDKIDDIPIRSTILYKIQEPTVPGDDTLNGTLDALQGKTLDELIDYLDVLLAPYEIKSEDGVVVPNEKMEKNEEELINSLINLRQAALNLQSAQGNLEEAAGALQDTINRLTPPATTPEPGTPGGGTTTPDVPVTPAAVVPLAAPAAPAAGEAQAPAGQVLGANRARGNQAASKSDLMKKLDTAAGAEDLSDDEKKEIVDELVKKDETGDQDLVEIKDEDVAMAKDLDKATVGWWWWILIAIFGATAIEAYRRHQKKKETLH